MDDLTPIQKETLEFIKGFIKKHSRSPTYEEIAFGFQIRTGAAYERVSLLRRKGYVACGRQWRSIQLLQRSFA